MFIGKHKWNIIYNEAIERLDREKAQRMEALNEIFAERRRAYELSKKLEEKIWKSSCGTLIGAMYGFYYFERRNYMYLLPGLAALGYLGLTTNFIFAMRNGRRPDMTFDNKFQYKELLPHIPLSLNEIRMRQSRSISGDDDMESDMVGY
uniref:Plasminogen receptor (KT) n=1 Tax=Syphacia muris TaxID=451379 RepID=A0A0N5ANM3_9BILA